MATNSPPKTRSQSLNAHVAVKGAEIFDKYGPHIGWQELQQILEDSSCVRYPCEIVFDAPACNPANWHIRRRKAIKPGDGFTMFVHPVFMTQLWHVPPLVLYQLVLVNYGPFASADDAETFGAAALDLSKDEYYNTLCKLADQFGGCKLPL